MLWFQVNVSTRREWTQCAMLQINSITRKVKRHEFRKGVWQMRDQPEGLLCGEGAPLKISGAFAVALGCALGKGAPIFQMPLVDSGRPRRSITKQLRSMGSHFTGPSLNSCDCVRPSMAIEHDQQLSHCEVSCTSAFKLFLDMELLL